MTASFVIRAGETARGIIRKKGLDLSKVRVIVGASGGPKWLALSRLDQLIFPKLLDKRSRPIFTLGSSIGSWRLSCLGQENPAEAVRRFETNYVKETWSGPVSRQSLTRYMRTMLETMIGSDGLKQILSNPWVHTNILAVRAKGIVASENDALLMLGLLTAFACNAVSRQSLGLFFERALFADPRLVPPFAQANDLPMSVYSLSEVNYYDAVLATSSIPFVSDAISPIDGADQGKYRDGGFTDYHFDMPFLEDKERNADCDDLVLYLHYRDRLIPAWLDKPLKWRKPKKSNLDRVVMIAPSDAFIDALPYRKLPDRGDFKKFDNDDRLTYWTRVLAETDRLADEVAKMIDQERYGAHVIPF